MLWLCSLQMGREGPGERQEEPVGCFTFVPPPLISFEQKIPRLNITL